LNKHGQPMESVRFALDPTEFFVTDERLDYTIVAVNSVSENNRQLKAYGWNKLMDEGKALIGDPLNIVQHPNGGYKQIVLQSNELIDLLPIHAHYLTDTEPGSSGSLVCNNQWEVVALHHAGVPKRVNDVIMDVHDRPWDGQDPDDIQWVANEGIRISRIIRHLEGTNIPMQWEATRRSIFDSIPPNPLELSDIYSDQQEEEKPKLGITAGGKSISWTIPLNVTVSIGDVKEGSGLTTAYASASDQNGTLSQNNGIMAPVEEKRVVPFIESDYSNRNGYDEDYLGVKVPLPELEDDTKVSRMDNGEFVIPYHHFSTVINKDRRMAYFCAANVDGSEESKEPEKDKDYTRRGLSGLGPNDHEAWLTDPRIPANHQLPDKFYNKDRKSFDKGHIVRRDDVAWGSNYDEVRASNGDTFHTTNCSPQVKQYNRSNLGGIWGKFENFVLDQAEDEKLVVFSGPLFRTNDRFFDGTDDRGKIRVKIPRAYWKIIVCKDGNTAKTFAFMFSQSLSDVDWDEIAAVPAKFKSFQCKVSDLQDKLVNIKLPQLMLDTDQKTSA
ncbi:MAG: DNA/RNA non-specific endonuclease, partial [Flavobacteriaceae bacterium]